MGGEDGTLMKNAGIALVAVMLPVLLLTPALCLVPDSSAEPEYGEYGAVYSFNYAELDAAVESATGLTVAEWFEGFLDIITGYDFDIDPDADARFGTTRNTVADGNDLTITDCTSGYIKGRLAVSMVGTLPDAGTYDRQDGESVAAFLDRVFVEQAAGRITEGDIYYALQVYMDLETVTRVDLSTGDITGTHVRLKFAIYENSDCSIDITTEGRGDELRSVTVRYGELRTDNNLFLDLGIDCTIRDLDAFSGTGDRVVSPVLTEHVNKFVISSDLAGSLWARTSPGSISAELPELILDLIGSGGRMQDLYETIYSLTGSTIPDVSFKDTFDASDATDANGYEYCKLVAQRSGGPTFYLYKGAYTLDLAHAVSNIPDSVMDPTDKAEFELVLTLLGWNDINVKDISEDQATKDECAEIREYVNVQIKEDDMESYSIPLGYTMAALTGIAASAALMVIGRRRTV